MEKKILLGFFTIVFLGALLTVVHWSLLTVAAVIGGCLIGDSKKTLSAFFAGILAWTLLISRYLFSGYFGTVNEFINKVAGLPALPLVLVIGGILSVLGALVGVTIHNVRK